MDDEDDHPLVAVIGTGLLSSFFDSPVDVRKPSRLNDRQFDFLVQSLYDQGRISADVLGIEFLQ